MPTIPIETEKLGGCVSQFAESHRLSKRESELLMLLAKNITASSAIAEALGVSVNTVNNHFKNIHPKTGTSSKPELLCTFFLFCLGQNCQTTRNKDGAARSLKVVLADDDADDRFIVKEALSEVELPIELDTVNDGAALLSYLDDRTTSGAAQPDLILLDIMMPAKNGFEVLEDLKKSNQLNNIPVVILSTYVSEKDVLKAYRMGAATYFHKPDSIQKTGVLLGNIYRFFGDAQLSSPVHQA